MSFTRQIHLQIAKWTLASRNIVPRSGIEFTLDKRPNVSHDVADIDGNVCAMVEAISSIITPTLPCTEARILMHNVLEILREGRITARPIAAKTVCITLDCHSQKPCHLDER
mmetsp:Transcript_87546/g.220910  ORF Transcript_87546/g.220910 Transcript_87546/m.220910 type:complete len:112 (-) Transcript_87546:215-550(-)